jgi:hypothetical protein
MDTIIQLKKKDCVKKCFHIFYFACAGRVDKLTPRAMPDPATSRLLPRATSHDGLHSNTSAENLRQSMQRLLQARQQQLQHEQARIQIKF